MTPTNENPPTSNKPADTRRLPRVAGALRRIKPIVPAVFRLHTTPGRPLRGRDTGGLA